jgi:hypothetical protein
MPFFYYSGKNLAIRNFDLMGNWRVLDHPAINSRSSGSNAGRGLGLKSCNSLVTAKRTPGKR